MLGWGMSDPLNAFLRRRLRTSLNLAYEYVWGPDGPYAFEQSLLEAFTRTFEATRTSDFTLLQRKRYRLKKRERFRKIWQGVDRETIRASQRAHNLRRLH